MSGNGLNLAGRAGKWSAENWKKALFGWLIFAVAAMAIGSVVGHVQMRESQYSSGETARAVRMLEQAGFRQPASEVVLIQSRKHTVADPIFISADRRHRPDPLAARRTSRTSRTRA